MKLTPRLPLLLCAGLMVAARSAAQAAIVVVAPTGATAGSLTITNDITFSISTTTIHAQLFVLDEWVSSDGSQTFSPYTPGLSLSINGGTPVSNVGGKLVDNLAFFPGGPVTANDGYFFTGNPFTVSAGDTVTLKATTYTLGMVAGFNPQANQAFTGNMFIAGGDGVQISNIVSAGPVPEPSTWALLLFAGTGLLGVARRACPRRAYAAGGSAPATLVFYPRGRLMPGGTS